MAGILTITATPAQAFTEPLTRAEVEMFLGLTPLSPANAGAEAELDMFISAAREQAELLQGQDIVEKRYDLTLDRFEDHYIELRRPLQSVELVRYRDSDGAYTSLIDGTDYLVDKPRGLVMPAYNTSWPSFTHWPSSAVLIQFTVSAVPYLAQHVRVGMLQLISDWYNDRLVFQKGANAADGYPMRLRMLLAAGGRNPVA